MKKIVLHGELAEKFGKEHYYDIRNTAEAIRALRANHKGFEKHLLDSKLYYQFYMGPTVVNSEEEIFYPVGSGEIIHIVPVIHGSKSGIGKVFVGAVILALAVATGGSSLMATPLIAGTTITLASIATTVGISLMLNGLSQMLAPHPKNEDIEKVNNAFNGPTNTNQQGLPVPVGYGRLTVGSAVIAQSIDVIDKTPAPQEETYMVAVPDGHGNTKLIAKTRWVQKHDLKSLAYANIIDLISEGPIEGVVDGLKGVYLNNTAVMSSDGTENFENVGIDTRQGYSEQDVYDYGSRSRNEIPVGVQLLEGVENVRTITNPDVDAVEITIGTPNLSNTNNDGDVVGTTASVAVYLQSNGGGYVHQKTIAMVGRSLVHYQTQFRLRLPEGESPWDIKLVRTTPDAAEPARMQDTTYWETYTEVVSDKLEYPHCAMVNISIPATAFTSIPTRGYDVKLRKIKIPSNATVRNTGNRKIDGSLSYSGSWDGTFKTNPEWCNDPAWILYDMLTNERFGCGEFIDEAYIDKWAFYSISQYCAELISDGFGSIEPRFACNIYIQNREEAYKVLQNLATVFRGLIYWSTGQITAVQDSPQEATALFTAANVVDGLFSYEGSSLNTRHSVALVAWNDPDDLCRQKIEWVEDKDAIERFGLRQTELVAVGATSRGQAHRVGKWLLYTEQYENEILHFQTGLEGATVRPNHIIKVADPMRAGVRLGGRIVSATTNTVTVDDDISLSLVGAQISVLIPDGSVETKNISSYSSRVVTIDGTFTSAPNAQAIWMIQTASVEWQLFRVLSVHESGDGKYTVTCMGYNPSKYAFVEDNLKLETPDITLLDEQPSAPANLIASESLYTVGSKVAVKVRLDFSLVPQAFEYEIQYQVNSGNFQTLPKQKSGSVEILDALEGEYKFRVTAISALGKRSAIAEYTFIALGKTAKPSDVTNFSLVPVDRQAHLTWDRATDLDVLIGGFIRIRHTPNIVGATWQNAVDVGPLIAGNTTQANLPLMTGTYLAKFIDSSGNVSANATEIITTIPDAIALNVVSTNDEAPSFLGTHSYTFAYTPLNAVVLSTDVLLDSYSSWDDIPSFDWSGGVVSEGTYTFQNTIDLTEVYTSRLTATIKAQSFLTDLMVDDVDDFDAWVNIDGDDFDDVNAVLYMRSTEDDPSGSPTWTEWKPFFIADYVARAFQFRLVLTSGNPVHNIAVTQCQVVIDMPDRIEAFYDVATGGGAYTLTYANPFKEIPTIGLTGKNLQSGDYWTITSQTRTSCVITFKNGVSNVNRTFDAYVRGYGRSV